MTDIKVCTRVECPGVFQDTRRGRIRAGMTGWWLGEDGRILCPRHRPHLPADYLSHRAQRIIQ